MSNPQPQPARPDRVIIGFTGRIGAGKTSAARYLEQAHGFQYVRYSQVLAEWLGTGPNAKARLQEVGWEVMSGGMQAELNSRLIAKIQPRKDWAVDGLRHPLDCESLRSEFGNTFFLVFLESSRETRWSRLQQQPRYRTFEAFAQAESHPVEQNIEPLRAQASFVIENNRTLGELHSSLETVLNQVWVGGRK